MERYLYALARRLWPELDSMNEGRRLLGVGDVIASLAVAPLTLAGLIWLVLLTRVDVITGQAAELILFLGLILLFNRVSYFFIVEIRTDRYGSADGSLAGMLQWAAMLIFGPTALWLSVVNSLINYAWNRRTPTSLATQWNQNRSLVMELAGNTLASLVALVVYERMGGVFPFAGFSWQAALPVVAAFIVQFLGVVIIWSVYTTYAIWIQRQLSQTAQVAPILRFLLLALGLPVLSHPFAIFLAGIYLQNGMGVFLFLMVGMMLVAFLARQLSWAAESSRQQSRQLERLEHLGRDIINSPPDASRLQYLLSEHVPGMFPSGRVLIWMLPDVFYLHHPEDWEVDIPAIWQWVRAQPGTHAFPMDAMLPWKEKVWRHDPVVLAPIPDAGDGQTVGYVYIELRNLAQPWDRKSMHSLFPAVQSLVAQVSSALHQAKIYAETLQYQATQQELEFAGRIQASFFPGEMPRLDGWELAVTLMPARETSGDYFDVFPLPGGRVGLLIADVADKGLGAALYMALSRTLIRTYALEYEASPDIVFFSVNERILQDARANLFVTAFYGILDQATGEMWYANAGHNPPFLLSNAENGAIHALTPTGMPIGIDEDASWNQRSIQIQPGDTLLLYTDGIPDAQNSKGGLFRERQLIEVAQGMFGGTAQAMQTAILKAVETFVGDASQYDDITLLIIQRDRLAEASGEDADQGEVLADQSQIE